MTQPLSGVRKKIHMLAENTMRQHGECPVLERGSQPWEAWRQWRKDQGLPTGFMDRQEQWTVPTTWPPPNLDEMVEATAGKGRLAGKLSQ